MRVKVYSGVENAPIYHSHVCEKAVRECSGKRVAGVGAFQGFSNITLLSNLHLADEKVKSFIIDLALPFVCSRTSQRVKVSERETRQ